MEIKQFVFNPFGVNCYILSNSKGEAILIDPSASNVREQAALMDYLKSENLKVVRVLNTHLHLDHVLGNAFAERTFGIKAEAHKDDTFLLDAQKEQSQMFGLPCNDLAPALGNYLNDGDIVEIAEIRLQVIHVAGHSPGGLAFFCENPGKVNGQDNVPPLLFPGSRQRPSYSLVTDQAQPLATKRDGTNLSQKEIPDSHPGLVPGRE